MSKTFTSINEGDELFYLKIANSKILLGENGPIFKARVQKVIKTCDGQRASMSVLRQIDGQLSFTVDLNTDVYPHYRSQDEIALDAEVFGTSKETVMDKALRMIKSRLNSIGAIKKKCDENIDDLLIAGAAIELEQEKNEDEVSLEEAASMAL